MFRSRFAEEKCSASPGLIGAGRTELARVIFGADSAESGSIELDGKELRIESPRDAIAAGIGLLTEDRKAQGLVLGRSARENFGLPNLFRFARAGFLRAPWERTAFGRYIESLGIKVSSQDQPAGNLSGGTQQKVVLAKWLERKLRGDHLSMNRRAELTSAPSTKFIF